MNHNTAHRLVRRIAGSIIIIMQSFKELGSRLTRLTGVLFRGSRLRPSSVALARQLVVHSSGHASSSLCSCGTTPYHYHQPRATLHTTATRASHQARVTTTNENRNHSRPPQRKHFWSVTELEQETLRLIDVLKAPDSTTQLDSFFDVLEAWMEISKDGRGMRAAQQARQLLEAMETSPRSVLRPATSFYDVVLQAHAVSGGRNDAAVAANRLLESMLSSSTRCKPTTKTFNIVLNCWAKSYTRDAGRNAEALLKRMREWSSRCLRQSAAKPADDEHCCVPDERTMASVMDAWARSGHPLAPDRVQQLLHQALEEGRKTQKLLVDLAVFHSVMHTWVRSRRGREAFFHIEAILRLMKSSSLKPNTRTFSLVQDSLARCEAKEGTGHAARRASDILSQMIGLYRNGVLDVKPSTYCFTTCIAAWSRCRKVPHAAREAQKLLQTLLDLYEETGDRAFRPDAATFNALIAAWARAATDDPTSMKRARGVLDQMKSFAKPNIVSYSTLLGGMALRGLGKDALYLLDWLERERPELQPDIISFNSALSALARDKTDEESAENAEALLRRMEKSGVQPDKISYTSVIQAWARSTDEKRTFRAEAIVDAMTERYKAGNSRVKPDTYVLTTLLSACALSTQGDHPDALAIAIRTMETLESGVYGRPNHISFYHFMKAINSLCTDEDKRRALIEDAFKACSGRRLVSRQIMKILDAEISKKCPIPQWSHDVPLHDRPSAGRAES